jgi:RHS repeat-associated protein
MGLVSEVRGGASKVVHADSLGTTRTLTDSSQSVTDSLETDAFGNVVTTAGNGVLGARPFGFAGQHGYQTDTDTGLMRLGHRYYDASTGRFISRDPIRDGYNWYTYCENDPINAVDPEGLYIEIADEIKAQYQKARAWVFKNSPELKAKWLALEKSDDFFNINYGTFYWNEPDASITDYQDGNFITWNPQVAFELVDDDGKKTGGVQSPAQVLAHEIDHLYQYHFKTDKYIRDIRTPDDDYDNKEEKRVITGSEASLAKKTGGQKRRNHKGKPKRVGSVLSR